MVAGANGPVQLLRCEGGATMSLGDADLGGGTCRPYVGELPGLAALDGLGAAAGPRRCSAPTSCARGRACGTRRRGFSFEFCLCIAIITC